MDCQPESMYGGSKMMAQVMNSIRLELEKCDSLDSIIFLGHFSGASGGGLLCNFLKSFEEITHKQNCIGFYGFPSPNFGISHQEPLNAILSVGFCSYYYNCNFINFDN